MSTDSTVSVVALTVALVALIVTLGQLLGQYFATADGYRRCQPPVMGPWAKHTRLRYRWSQFRFETLFTIPEIILKACPAAVGQDGLVIKGEAASQAERVEWITGSPESRSRTYALSAFAEIKSDELVSWLPLLRSLHQHESALHRYNCYYSDPSQLPGSGLVRPAVRFRERSWDFVTPNAVRPQALSTISDIAVIARRLGMTWEDFRPQDGIMQAEGNGHVLSSTSSLSTGIVLHYSNTGSSFPAKQSLPFDAFAKSEIYIPSEETDMMGFGILPGYTGLDIPTFRIGTIADVYTTMDTLDPSHRASKTIRDIRGIEPDVTFGFSDIIPMAAPMLRQRGSCIIRVPVPSEYSVGLTCHKEGFVIFWHRLDEYITERNDAVSAQTRWVRDQYEALCRQHLEWEDEALANAQINERDLAFLDKVHTCWDHATAFLETLSRNDKAGSRIPYTSLMAAHLTQAVGYWGDAWTRIREGRTREHYGMRDWIAEGAHVYWDYLPAIVRDMRMRGFEGEEERVHEAWIVMMFRAFCWWRCHFLNRAEDMVKGQVILPAKYWKSKLPVYIG